MGGYKVEQRFVTHHGRRFHFVSYDGQPAIPKKDLAATKPTWFMMGAGKRWEVMPQLLGQDITELDGLLTQWLDIHVFAA